MLLMMILFYGIYSRVRTSQIIQSFQTHDIPTLQLSCASSRVITETELLLNFKVPDLEKINGLSLVLDDSLKELIHLSQDFPAVSNKFLSGDGYLDFKRYVEGEKTKDSPEIMFKKLKSELQSLVEDYLLMKNETVKERVFISYLSAVISLFGIVIFFALIYAIYLRFQKNTERMEELAKRLEQERLVTIQSSKMASLGEMAAGIAHEINNPLAVIVGRIQILTDQIDEKYNKDPEMLDQLEKMNEMLMRIADIVQSMRRIAKSSEQEEVSQINLSSVIDDVLNLSFERLKFTSIKLDKSQVNSKLWIEGNFTHISQILTNLMNNSIDELLKQPDSTRQIWISTIEKSGAILVLFEDSGPGIATDIREKIFQPFFSTKEVGKGTGLGLSISKSLMNQMGGDLFLSTSSQRTTFVLKFKKNI